MDGQILFSRHLRLVLKQGYGDQMSDERINKLLASCWKDLNQDSRHVYEILAKDKRYLEDIRGVREHNKNGNNKKAFVESPIDMDAFGAKLSKAAKKKYNK